MIEKIVKAEFESRGIKLPLERGKYNRVVQAERVAAALKFIFRRYQIFTTHSHLGEIVGLTSQQVSKMISK